MFWYMIIIIERLIEIMMETKLLLTELDPHNHLQQVRMCRISLHLSNRKMFLKKRTVMFCRTFILKTQQKRVILVPFVLICLNSPCSRFWDLKHLKLFPREKTHPFANV